MKLLTHNMLTSHVKGVKEGYPLRILVKKLEVKAVEFNGVFIQRMMKKIKWDVLKGAAESVGQGAGLPASPPQCFEDDQQFLTVVHHLLMEIEIVEGELECPESGRRFPIQDGIPNMLLREDEV